MSQTIQLSHVVIWYAATPEAVEVRVRSYAEGVGAVREQSFFLEDRQLQERAQGEGRDAWEEADLCALLPLDGCEWGGTPEATALRSDVIDQPRGAVAAPAEPEPEPDSEKKATRRGKSARRPEG